jgi:hypothetical protein
MSEKEIPSVKDALNEFFRLKEQFENQNNVNKIKIINNPTLSKREKKSKYLKLMPKCVNCKRPSKKGTLFSINYNPSNDKIDEYRTFKASCGDLADPCNLNIEINVGMIEPIDKSINSIQKEITDIKNEIINDKNKLLFGLITTETALENFDNNKSYIRDLTSIYESYLDIWNSKVDSPEKKSELDEALVQSYEVINNIKDCIKKMNENNDKQFAIDAVTIYYTTLEPLLKKIRQLKYKENMVLNDDSSCKLIQKRYNLYDLTISGFTENVAAYDVGLKAKKPQKKKPALFIVESDSSAEKESEPSEEKEITIKIQKPGEPKPTDEVEEDEPIIGQGKDGIAWNNPKYQYLWDRLPEKLKTEFKLNIDWMKEFMHKCVNERISHGPQWRGCKLTTPPNLVIPPRQMENGQYDFGVSIYNKAFNSQPKSLQNTYLTFYKEDPSTKEKNYNMLIDSMNSLVEKEVNFGRGFF